MRRVWRLRLARILCLRGLDGMGSHTHRRVANWQQRCVRAAAASLGCGSLHATMSACFRLRTDMLAARSARCIKKLQKLHQAPRGMSRTGLRPRLGLATATPALAALRLPHEHARAEHACHARTMRARLASDARALTLQPALARQKARLPCSSHWPLADRRPAGR